MPETIATILPRTDTNSTAVGREDEPLNWAILSLIPIICLVAAGNILVILAVCMDRKLRSATNYFLTSLAVADLLVALTVMPPSVAMIINNYEWPLSDDLCGVWVMLDVCFSTSSILHLCMISLDRYLALARPFGRSNKRQRGSGGSTFNGIRFGLDKSASFNKRVASRICMVWTVALGIAIPLPILGRQDRNNLMIGNMCAINMAEFATFGSLVAFFLPLVIMFIMYTLTIRMLRKQARAVSHMIEHASSNSSTYPSAKPEYTKRTGSLGDSGGPTGIERSTLRIEYSELTNHFEGLSLAATDDEASMTDSIRSVLLTRSPSVRRAWPSNGKCPCEQQQGGGVQHRWAASLPLAKALQQVQVLAGVGAMIVNRSTNQSVEAHLLKKRCNCEDSHRNEDDQRRKKKKLFLHRRLPSYNRRAMGSFKSRAMASINNEQRASKILGLIFVLFCLFWCPFFITNVVSRFCNECNQALMAECMNWFVWVGYVSSGVNPCVYTMFSGRFRRTFAMLIRCKCSAINNRTTRQSYSSNRDNFSNASFRATSSLHRTNSKQLSKPPDPVMTPSMRSSLAGVERESVRGERVVRSTSASHRFIQNQHNAIYVKNQTKIQPSYCTAKLWRSTWHASTMGCNVTPQIMTSSQIPKPEAHDGTNFKRHYSANDVTEKVVELARDRDNAEKSERSKIRDEERFSDSTFP